MVINVFNLLPLCQVPVALAVKGIVFRQNRAKFYSNTVYTLAVNLVHLPLAFLEAAIFACGVYWMTGFVDATDRFFFFLLVLILISSSTACFFRLISYIVPSMEVGQVLVGPANALLIQFCGILITRAKIPPWFIWVYYISPFSWSIRSLALNEFESGRYAISVGNNTNASTTLGQLYLDAYEFQSGDDWKWSGIIFLSLYLLLMASLCVFILNCGKPSGTRGTSRVDEEDDENKSVSLIHVEHQKLFATTIHKQALRKSPTNERATMLHKNGISPEISNPLVPRELFSPTDASKHESHLPFEKASLVFRDLSYDVVLKSKETKRLLHEITGYAREGQLTALMGVTGAGKTTLMDVLARRKTDGKCTGSVFINGYIPEKAYFAKLVGYCEQNDLHEPFATVEEALHFSAALRLDPTISSETRQAFIEEIMELIELQHLRHRLIGQPGQESSLSQGQRKRLTLGVELVANTSILFLDEPTSQLDSREAEVVMRVIRNVARTGRTIVCTIHQPNAEIFSMFDQLLLLARGGRCVYHGPIIQLQPYLEAIPGTLPKPAHVNPATWMLDVIGASSAGVSKSTLEDDKGTDFHARFETSLEYAAVNSMVEQLLCDRTDEEATTHRLVTSHVSRRTQLTLVTKRAFKSSWRNTDYNFTRLLVIACLSVVFGLLYLQIEATDLAGVVSKMSAIFSTAVFCGAIHLLTGIPVVG